MSLLRTACSPVGKPSSPETSSRGVVDLRRVTASTLPLLMLLGLGADRQRGPRWSAPMEVVSSPMAFFTCNLRGVPSTCTATMYIEPLPSQTVFRGSDGGGQGCSGLVVHGPEQTLVVQGTVVTVMNSISLMT